MWDSFPVTNFTSTLCNLIKIDVHVSRYHDEGKYQVGIVNIKINREAFRKVGLQIYLYSFYKFKEANVL